MPAVALGAVERFEDTRHRLRVHARAGVRDREHGLRWLAARERDRDRDHPPVPHCVPGVDGEVHDHLLELAAIGLDEHRCLGRGDDELDAIADELPEQPLHRRDDVAQVEHLGLEHLAPAEREQLLGQKGGAVRGFEDVLDVLAGRVFAPPQPAERELAEAADPEQEVVEVMGDPAGQLPDRLEALGLAKLLFECLAALILLQALGEISHDRERPVVHAVLVEDRARAHRGVQHGAVAPPEADIDRHARSTALALRSTRR